MLKSKSACLSVILIWALLYRFVLLPYCLVLSELISYSQALTSLLLWLKFLPHYYCFWNWCCCCWCCCCCCYFPWAWSWRTRRSCRWTCPRTGAWWQRGRCRWGCPACRRWSPCGHSCSRWSRGHTRRFPETQMVKKGGFTLQTSTVLHAVDRWIQNIQHTGFPKKTLIFFLNDKSRVTQWRMMVGESNKIKYPKIIILFMKQASFCETL